MQDCLVSISANASLTYQDGDQQQAFDSLTSRLAALGLEMIDIDVISLFSVPEEE